MNESRYTITICALNVYINVHIFVRICTGIAKKNVWVNKTMQEHIQLL